MIKTFLSIFLSIAIVVNHSTAVADEVKQTNCDTADNKVTCLAQQGNTTTTTTTTLPPGTVSDLPMSGNTTTTTTFGSAGTAGSGAYAQAQQAKNQANTTMIMGLAMAAMFATQCGTFNPTACMLAAAAAAAAMMAAGKKSEAQNLMNTLGNQGSTTSTTDGTTDAATQAQLDQVRADLAKKGYTLNADGSFTAPNGATVDSNLSESSLQNAGLNTSDVNGVKAGLDKMRKDFKDKLADSKDDAGLGVDGLGDAAMSGAYGSRGAAVSGASNGKGSAFGGDRMGLDRDPAAWDGYYKQYGDSLIGISQNDIFMMVQKRVESERKVMGH